METVYAAMLLHKAGKPIDEDSLRKVLDAAGINADEGKIKATVAALKGVDIEKVLKEATVVAPAATAAPAADEKSEGKKEEKKDDKKSEEEAAAGLGALFG